eukprot:1008547-Alexandrium_andersonii.AAC.1
MGELRRLQEELNRARGNPDTAAPSAGPPPAAGSDFAGGLGPLRRRQVLVVGGFDRDTRQNVLKAHAERLLAPERAKIETIWAPSKRGMV